MKTKTMLNNNLDRKISKNAIVEPIYMTTTYKQNSVEKRGEYLYTGLNNPNFESLERKLNFIEKESLETIVFPTGMSAITAIVISLLEKGDKIICNNNTYVGTNQVFGEIIGKFGTKTDFIDLLDTDLLKEKITKKTKLIWIEVPSNPLLRLYDVKKISKIAKKNNIIVCVDSSLLSSINISPLELGADIVVQSATKYIGGTSDVMGGVVSSNNKKLCDKVKKTRNILGLFPSPFNCWLLEKGLKTYPIRMNQIEKNSNYIAKKLTKLKFVESVIYPGLKTYPQYKIAKEQIKGNGGIISVRLKLTYEQIKKGFSKFKLWNPAVGYGGTESLIDFSVYIGGRNLTKEAKDMIGDNLVRLSVGIEDKEDLLEDFIQAFN